MGPTPRPRFLEVAPRDREVAEAAGVRDGRREFGVVALPIGAWTIGYSISSRSPKLRGGGPFLNGVSGANGVGRGGADNTATNHVLRQDHSRTFK